jgi:long-chain acyl-CoA synthetase
LYEVFTKDDTYLAFLPLAHILEFVVENSFIFAGMPIGYGRVKTLTDASVRECKGDLTDIGDIEVRGAVNDMNGE